MPASNVKVVSVLPGWWRIVALFGAGVGAEVGTMVVGYVLAYIPDPRLVLLTGILVPLSFSEQRLRRSCLEAVAVGTGLTVGLVAAAVFTRGRAGDPVRVAGEALFFVLLCLVIRLVSLWFVRSFIRRLVVQTGSLCWTCAYDLTGNESGVCPECGAKIGS